MGKSSYPLRPPCAYAGSAPAPSGMSNHDTSPSSLVESNRPGWPSAERATPGSTSRAAGLEQWGGGMWFKHTKPEALAEGAESSGPSDRGDVARARRG
eukprot:scaffold3382_cov108-Isochrysis_galbana.AAC.3